MAKIDASRISPDALSELQAGDAVPLVKRGRTIATSWQGAPAPAWTRSASLPRCAKPIAATTGPDTRLQ